MRLIPAVSWATLLLLYLPLLAVAAYSFNASRSGLAWSGFTLDWYRALVDDELYRRLFAHRSNATIVAAASTTLCLALISTAIATVLGTALAIGLARAPWPWWARRWFDLTLHLPVVTPDIVLAAALVVAFSLLRQWWPVFEPGLTTLVIGHVTFQIPFVALIVASRLRHIGRHQEEAARDLYAGTGYVLRRIVLPQLAPAIAAGALLAFTLSIDDFVISFFLYSPDTRTLPVHIYAELKRGLPPDVNALSTLIMGATVMLVLVVMRLTPPTREPPP